MDLALLAAVNAERAERRAAAVLTDIATGHQRLVRETDAEGDPLADALQTAFRTGRSGMVASPKGEAFLSVQVPPTRILVIGAVHISQALAPMARLAGFDISVIDPRTAFATDARFPGIAVTAAWPEDVLPAQPLDRYTALVALTHDPKIDDLPLRAALDAGCFYIGALGSRKTHAGRLERLVAAGATAADLARIDAPIGLDIGAANPAEIAVAVLGAIIRALRRREGTVAA